MDDIDKTLEVALKRELESVKLYTYLKSRNNLDDFKITINRLLDFENEHVRIIRELWSTHNFDTVGQTNRTVRHFPEVEIPLRFEELITDPKKMVAFAIKREERSFKFYAKMCKAFESHIILADIAKKLMVEEVKHRLELEQIYRNIK
jgi:rubrerythrin